MSAASNGHTRPLTSPSAVDSYLGIQSLPVRSIYLQLGFNIKQSLLVENESCLSSSEQTSLLKEMFMEKQLLNSHRLMSGKFCK